MHRLLPSAFLLCAASACATEVMEVKPKAVKPTPAPYALIALVGTGPSFGGASQEIRGRFNRLVVVRRGLAYDHPVLRIETLSYGDEGCCSKVASAKELDLNELALSGLKLPDPTTSEVESMRWTASDDVTIRYGAVSCGFQGVLNTRVKVSCTQ